MVREGARHHLNPLAGMKVRYKRFDDTVIAAGEQGLHRSIRHCLWQLRAATHEPLHANRSIDRCPPVLHEVQPDKNIVGEHGRQNMIDPPRMPPLFAKPGTETRKTLPLNVTFRLPFGSRQGFGHIPRS